MMRNPFQSAVLATILTLSCTAFAEQPPAKPSASLRVFFIDVEGGQATLFVTPANESLLIDTGWPGQNFRDADRIAAAAKRAGLTRIDYVLITHFHADHVGGVPQLVQRLPVGTFIDHGENRETNGYGNKLFADYQQVLATGQSKHIIAKPGDVLPLTGIHATVLSADGNLIHSPLPGGGQPNPLCATTKPAPDDTTENQRSLGIEITFGKLTILDLGDLTKDKERQLVCPANLIGHPDIYIVSHHGWEQSSSQEFVHALHPRVAIMDNGETKGGSTPVLDTIRSSPGLEDLWQIHYSAEGAEAHNTKPENIANLLGADTGTGLTLTANRNGSFTITNDRTGQSKTYPVPH